MAFYHIFECVGLLLMFSTFWEHFEGRNCVEYLLLEILNSNVDRAKFSFKSNIHYFLHLGRGCKCGLGCHTKWHKCSFKLCETGHSINLCNSLIYLYLKDFFFILYVLIMFSSSCLLSDQPHLPTNSAPGLLSLSLETNKKADQ